MDPLIRATLYLTSHEVFDPAVVSERTGLAMREGMSLGQERVAPSGSTRTAKWSFWTHGNDSFDRTFDMEGVLNRLLDEIDAAEPAISAVRDDLGLSAHITLGVQMDDDVTPDGTLSASTLGRLVEKRIDLDLDLYTWQQDRDVPP